MASRGSSTSSRAAVKQAAARRWHRRAAGWLLVGAGVQLVAHWQAYLDSEHFDSPRRAVQAAMQAYQPLAGSELSLWTVLGSYSLSAALLLAIWGSGQWILAAESPLPALRRHALRQALLCALASVLLLCLHPLPQALILFTGAAMLFALAWSARPQPGPTEHAVSSRQDEDWSP